MRAQNLKCSMFWKYKHFGLYAVFAEESASPAIIIKNRYISVLNMRKVIIKVLRKTLLDRIDFMSIEISSLGTQVLNLQRNSWIKY